MQVIPGSDKRPVKYSREDVDAQNPKLLLQRPNIPKGAPVKPVPCEVKAGYYHFHHGVTFQGSYGHGTANPRQSYILHLMPGNTRRIGNWWKNPRQGRIEEVSPEEIVKGPSYPELPLPVLS